MTKSTRLLPAGLQLSAEQIESLDAFGRELRRMNTRINLVSSETESEFWKRHTAHCLALATRHFPPGSRLVDWGTGGGLPAIPLAIVFPNVEVIGVDSVRKKVQSCSAIARRIGLENCSFVHGRAEEVSLRADYSVSRATAPLATLWNWHTRIATPGRPTEQDRADEQERKSRQDRGSEPERAHHSNARPKGLIWPRGLICLKGGDLTEEIRELMDESARSSSSATGHGQPDVQTFPLSGMFEDPWFEEKVIVQVQSG